MPKFSGRTPVANANKGRSPIRTTVPALTFEGGEGFARDAKSELFLLAVTNMVGEDTFYESAVQRDDRFEKLVHQVTVEDPAWMQGFIPWLRDSANMRSASVVMAAEYLRAGGPEARKVIAAACRRADEPAEVIGYWHAKYGRNLPMALKRGVADAALALYNERSALRYDGQSRGIRMADVLELTHPKPADDRQSALFHYLIDRRHNRGNMPPPILGSLVADHLLSSLPEDKRREALHSAEFTKAGWSWERLSGWLPGGMDAAAWEAVIPKMGYMALLRNLRNFEQAGISKPMVELVCDRLSDPDEVAKSRQFPFRFFSAYKNTNTLQWAQAIEEALDHSVANIPSFSGRTLVLVDLSGSMAATISKQSTVHRYEIGAVFGAALARRADDVTLVGFGTDSAEIGYPKHASVLRTVQVISDLQRSRRLQWGTNIWPSVRSHYAGHDRLVIFTDEQAHPDGPSYRHGHTGGNVADVVAQIPNIHIFNLAGYAVGCQRADKGRFAYGGFSDQTFTLMSVLEQVGHGTWPWE